MTYNGWCAIKSNQTKSVHFSRLFYSISTILQSPPCRWGLEYADCYLPAEGLRPHQKGCLMYDTKQSLMMKLQLFFLPVVIIFIA